MFQIYIIFKIYFIQIIFFKYSDEINKEIKLKNIEIFYEMPTYKFQNFLKNLL